MRIVVPVSFGVFLFIALNLAGIGMMVLGVLAIFFVLGIILRFPLQVLALLGIAGLISGASFVVGRLGWQSILGTVLLLFGVVWLFGDYLDKRQTSRRRKRAARLSSPSPDALAVDQESAHPR